MVGNLQAIVIAESISFRLGLPGRLQDQIRDRVGLGYQGKVTRLHLDRLCTHPLRTFEDLRSGEDRK